MAAFNFHRRQTRRWWLAGTTMALLATGILMLAGSAFGTLSGSSFNTANGDLTTLSTTIHDWNPAGSPVGELGPIQTITCPSAAPGSGTNCALDLVGSSSDNSLGQGTKEDDITPTVVDGQIPPNKDDLSRFYINQEVASSTGGVVKAGDNLLYLAWERSNLLGSAHMDFELNQHPVGITGSTTGTVDINRTAGDVLIDFDFGGSGVPTLQWHKWETAAVNDTGVPSADCAASTTYPCWSVAHDIGAAGEASVNGAPVKDYNAPVPTAGFNTLNGTTTFDKNGNPKTVSSTFGEAGIDLQASGIFSSFQCTRFGDAWLKSRSAGSSFVSELKDFIAPLPINISNCGEIKIIKNTIPANTNKDFSYTSNVPSGTATNAATFSTTPDSTNTANTPFTLNARNDVTISSVTPGDPNTTITTNKPVSLSGQALANGDNVTITGTNTTPIMDGTYAVSGVSNTATSTTFSIPFATSAVGSAPLGSLVFNTEDITNVVPNGTNGAPTTYTVNETPLPSGWSLKSLTCTTSGTAGSTGSQDGTTLTQANITVVSGGVVTCTYTNQAQAEIKIIKHTSPRGINQVFSYTSGSGGALGLGTDSTAGGVNASPCTAAGVLSGSFCLNDSGNTTTDNTANTLDVKNLSPGSYNVTESEPTGWTLGSLSCTNDTSSGSSGSQHSTGSLQADITLKAGGLVTCTYVNNQPTGAILITKQAKDHNCTDVGTPSITEGTCAGAALADLKGAKFQVWSETNGCTGLQTASSDCAGAGTTTAADTQMGSEQTTGQAGTTCFDNLPWNGSGTSYYVIETGAPTGFSNDNSTAVTKTVTQNAKCTDSNIATKATTMTATDAPLTNLTVNVASVVTGATNSSITCVIHGTTTNIGNSPQPATGMSDPLTMNANASNSKQLKPGTYDCQVVIDP